MNPTQPDSHAKPLIGRQLLSVEKKDYTWFFGFGDGTSLATESPWRLIDQNRIVVGSEDHDQQFGRPAPLDATREVLSCAGGLRVEAASIAAGSGDLSIRFCGGTYLQLLQLSVGFESWRLSTEGGEIICTGGGNIAHCPRS